MNLDLTPEDKLFLEKKCHSVELPEQVILDFIADLIGSRNSAGSDERNLAQQWFNRRYL